MNVRHVGRLAAAVVVAAPLATLAPGFEAAASAATCKPAGHIVEIDVTDVSATRKRLEYLYSNGCVVVRTVGR